jgi:hypothetical protein
MRVKTSYLLILLIVLTVLCHACEEETDSVVEAKKTNRTIKFSGMEWIVRKTNQDLAGPGPNYFSDSEDNVWVDAQGRLHLKIRQVEGKWQCSGVSLRRSLSYGKYTFYLASDVTDLDPNVVAGLFTYMNDNEEIDIEFSQWSDPQNINAQFAVQPSYKEGNKVRFDYIPRANHLSTHFFDWKSDSITFGSRHGHSLEPEPEDEIYSWTYSGENIPPDSNERLKINLWLFRGNAPANMEEAELIIDRVEIH